MLAYFARRLVGGAFTVLASTFIFYSLIFFRGNPTDKPHFDMPARGVNEYDGTRVLYALDDPWPFNYLMWLVALDHNPHRTFPIAFSPLPREEIDRGRRQRDREGLLFGDLGVSLWIAPGIAALAAYGINLPLLLYFIFTTLFSAMLIVALQRRGRPPVYCFIPPESPATTIWRRAELWPLG